VKGKKAVALGSSLSEKLQMAWARGCSGRPWLPTVASSDAGARRWRRVAPGAAVGGSNQRKRMGAQTASEKKMGGSAQGHRVERGRL
jgi:hypothetical protein